MAFRSSVRCFIVITILSEIFFKTVAYSEESLPGNGTCQNPPSSSPIIGGKKAKKDHFPFIVSIRPKDKADLVIGGGSIIRSNWILTARHLFLIQDQSTQRVIGLRELTIAPNYGNKLSIAKDKKKYQVEKMFCYPPGTQSLRVTDVGLLKLTQDIPLDNSTGFYFDKISIPGSGGEVSVEQGVTKLDVAGWGQTKRGSKPKPQDFPDDLMAAHVRQKTDKKCRKMFPYYVTPEMFCVGSKRKTTGAGDSGGPVTTRRKGKEEPIQVGIISSGRADCSAGTICMNLFHFGDWVQKTMNDEDPQYECKNVFPVK